ncbi:DUF899 family protein [Pelagibius sp. 7325]|uniref:DUF899 family protein n=1 Tax=Pelagibius sp. 7325 TaxID=3131994 RepID=UPI0030EB97DB
MTTHVTGTREEGLAARLALPAAEKDLTRRSDELARRRRELPWVRVDKAYRFDTDDGGASLAKLGRRQAGRLRRGAGAVPRRRRSATIGRAAQICLAVSIVASVLTAGAGRAAEPVLERMPADLEARFALSALPAALREGAAVYLLDPQQGYRLSREGTSGLTCLVERTVWEWVDFRDDIYIPLCYDAAGTKAHLKVIMDAAALRAEGMGPAALKAEIERRYRDGIYRAPEKPGLSYMVGPVMRALGPPDFKLHTMAMPHLMVYAPHATNEDIGAQPELADRATLVYPFIDRQGNGEQTYIIQMLGEAEKAQILADEKTLVEDLCAYRDVLCLPEMTHAQ